MKKMEKAKPSEVLVWVFATVRRSRTTADIGPLGDGAANASGMTDREKAIEPVP